MGLVRIFLLALAVIVAAAIGFAAYIGAFKPVEISRGSFGPVTFVYGTHVGPYSKLSESWTAFLTETSAQGLEACESLAAYLDPPGTPQDEKRAILGCRIDGLPEEARDRAVAALPVFELRETEALLGAFPYKNVASYWVGPMRVYPEMAKEIDQLDAPPVISIEVYGVGDANGVVGEFEEIVFAMPLDLDRADIAPLEAAFD